jgi:hypothetical protein
VPIDGTPRELLLLVFTINVLSNTFAATLTLHLCVQGWIAFGFWIPIFGAHHVPSSRTSLTIPPRWFSQRLHPDEDLPQCSAPNNPPTHILSTIVEGLEHLTISDIPKIQLQHLANNTSTTANNTASQNASGTSSTQTNGGGPHHFPQWTPSPIQVIQGDIEIEQVQVQDWEEEDFKEEVAEDEELLKVP